MKTLSYFKRALSLPPHILLQKIAQKLKKKYESKRKKYHDQMFPTFSRDVPFSSLNRFVEKRTLSLLPKEEVFAFGKRCLSHEFDLLGSGWVRVIHGMECRGLERFRYVASSIQGDRLEGRLNRQNLPEAQRIWRLISPPYVPIDWQLDFKSGYRWNEVTWSAEIRYGSHLGADVKAPWELARMQHLVCLAWNYGLQQDAAYLIEFRNQILDFISTNPPRFGVNWVCTMDVGIRIANWLLAYDLFRSFDAQFDSAFEAVFIRSVYAHGKHIRNHLEWDPHLRSNHYLANLAGLLFAAAYLGEASWLDFSVREMIQEVFLQFHPDGSNFEASTSYHRLSSEMVVHATALGLQAGAQFPQEYLERVQKMGDFIRDIAKPDGQIVQFGDNDSGRFIKMYPDQDSLDHRYLIGAIRNLKNLNSVIEGQLHRIEEKGREIAAYPDFGAYIQRTDRWFLAVRCGSIGQKGNGGHAHNDQLSFELAVDGVSAIVDPGTYLYTPLPEARRRFRSTAMHNTLSVVGKEQNRDEGLFKMEDKAKAKILQFGDGIFIGEHCGFGAIHRRTFKIFGDRIEGMDECGAKEKRIYFHFAPGWEGKLIDTKEAQWTFGKICLRMISDCGAWSIERGEYSKRYGEKESSFTLVLQTVSQRTKWEIFL